MYMKSDGLYLPSRNAEKTFFLNDSIFLSAMAKTRMLRSGIGTPRNKSSKLVCAIMPVVESGSTVARSDM